MTSRGNCSAPVVRRGGPTGPLLIYGMHTFLLCTLSGEPGTGPSAPPGRALTHYPHLGTGRITRRGLELPSRGGGPSPTRPACTLEGPQMFRAQHTVRPPRCDLHRRLVCGAQLSALCGDYRGVRIQRFPAASDKHLGWGGVSIMDPTYMQPHLHCELEPLDDPLAGLLIRDMNRVTYAQSWLAMKQSKA